MLSTILVFLGSVITAYLAYRGAVEVARINAEADYDKTVAVAIIAAGGAGVAQVPKVPRKRWISTGGTADKALERGFEGGNSL